MNTLKEKFVNSLGGAGLIVWWLFSLAIVVIPVILCRFKLWVEIAIIAIILFTNVIGGIASFAVFVISFIKVITVGRYGVLEIIYFPILIFYIVRCLIPSLVILFKKDR